MKIEPVHHTCVIHQHCHVYWWPDPDRNRLRGRSTHVRAWTLFNGVANDEVMMKLPNVTVPNYPHGSIGW